MTSGLDELHLAPLESFLKPSSRQPDEPSHEQAQRLQEQMGDLLEGVHRLCHANMKK